MNAFASLANHQRDVDLVFSQGSPRLVANFIALTSPAVSSADDQASLWRQSASKLSYVVAEVLCELRDKGAGVCEHGLTPKVFRQALKLNNLYALANDNVVSISSRTSLEDYFRGLSRSSTTIDVRDDKTAIGHHGYMEMLVCSALLRCTDAV